MFDIGGYLDQQQVQSCSGSEKSKLPFRLVLPTKLNTLHIKRAQPFWCFSAVTTRWSSPRPGKGILSAPNPGFGIWDFAWNLATRVKFGTYEQNRNFFEKIDLHRLHMGPEDLYNRKTPKKSVSAKLSEIARRLQKCKSLNREQRASKVRALLILRP